MTMESRPSLWLCILLCGAAIGVGAQQADKPLTNADVVKMVKGGLPESVVVSTIRSHPGKFDVSPDGLIALHKAGVTPSEMDAIMAAQGKDRPASASPSAAATAEAGAPASKSRMPKAFLMDGPSRELPLEKTQLAETKTKPSSMRNLAADSAVTQAMQAGVNTAVTGTAMHMNSGVGGSAMGQAGSILSGMMAHRKPSVTYVWGVANPASANVLQKSLPSFSVNFSNTPGVTLDDFEPAIVKLTPAQNTCRIVGATQGKEDMRSSPAADWQIYSSFLEERVGVKSEKVKPGQYKIAPTSPLMPGEYAIVLRPISKSKKFSGGDVARAQGEGLMFDAVWSFQISNESE